VQLEPTKFMPTLEQMRAEKSKVVIFPIDEKAPLAKKAGAGSVATGEVEKYLLEAGSVELVDRSAAEKMKDELALIELSGKGEISSPQIADYAVMGEISSVQISSMFWPSGKPGKQMVGAVLQQLTGIEVENPPEYEYTASVKGKLKIFQLATAKMIKTIELDDDKSITKLPLALGWIVTNIPPNLPESEEIGLITGAASDAVESARFDLKNFFSRKGYVLEKRTSPDGKHFIFLVSFGTSDGAKEGEEVVIYTLEESASKLGGPTTVEEVPIGKAKIADILKSNECWIHTDDAALAERIKMGDYVKIHYSKGLGDYAKKAGKILF
ncbi:MAG: hypothetical protein K6347_04885, partial [Campylobacterales bacterium]